MMTRLDAIKARLAAATPWPVDVFEQDLRDLLELYDAIKTMKPGYPWDNRVHAILSTLDSPVGDEGAK